MFCGVGWFTFKLFAGRFIGNLRAGGGFLGGRVLVGTCCGFGLRFMGGNMGVNMGSNGWFCGYLVGACFGSGLWFMGGCMGGDIGWFCGQFQVQLSSQVQLGLHIGFGLGFIPFLPFEHFLDQ